ncbi:uroporphyrinogen-III C-methyltransferase [Chitinophaga sancti]|uniref:uroporphyrinogen-III C-methyltransferase n=1 Tax=Chitinophaga sancti TaxID=1004 RepID=A0A1K1QVG2_9BACT|nr:uroporphyrinogen-III C-methyltransferase [Chitinophaga sancti]WQD61991.1 uroporphyrinogen-III C-methyltransferase [Chitinophaga sancti]WQG92440.1 uroporphyrinogen-III C-methyltransferase [Chitinophaga sancti]SFW63903.1 uroporphyrin-III C-methyltransferase [Chitinophaga sancti]
MAKLSLVGAGPGDPELITLKAINVLKRADVILYDALVNEELLSYAKPAAVLQFVGKRYGCHSLSQQEINHLIVEYAYSHGHVVRLKGGDPFVFGRAGEEIAAANAAGIQVEVIPGISSALAAAESQMIPLTSRGVTESFWVTTGTTLTGDISGDIELAARSTATVIILMAMSKLEAIMEIFTEHGKKDLPVAIIQEATTGRDKMVVGTVTDIYYKAQHEGMANPAVIVVGEVVRLRNIAAEVQALIKKKNNEER